MEKTAGFKMADHLFVYWAMTHGGKPIVKGLAYRFAALSPPVGEGPFYQEHGYFLGVIPRGVISGLLCDSQLDNSTQICEILQAGCGQFITCTHSA